MSRALVFTLSCVVLSGLSCGSLKELPPVAAGPPAVAVRAEVETPPDPYFTAALAILRAHRTGLTENETEKLAHTIVAQATHHGLDPGLVLAVMDVESNYNTYAVSPVGAMGLMQIMPATGRELAEKAGVTWRGSQTLFDPFVNVQLGVAYLRQLSDRYESLAVALAAYNWGPGHIDRRLRRGTPMPKQYPDLVFAAYSGRPRQNS